MFIWVRTSIDWSDEAALPSLVKPEFLTKLELWNETFSIPYSRFRHEVCEIARLNLSRVERALVRPWDEIPEGAVVLPVDDDDWFAPDIVRRWSRSSRRIESVCVGLRRTSRSRLVFDTGSSACARDTSGRRPAISARPMGTRSSSEQAWRTSG